MRELTPGTVFAGHRIESVVGRGGMGVVYRARQLDLERVVALKVVSPDLLDHPAMRDRFLREARAAASIDHPNVIPVFSAGESEGIAYLTMRYVDVDGDDVRSLVRRTGPLPPERAAEIAARAAAALDAVHAAGLVHRDVKPANLLLGPEGHVYVTDFGLAKSALSQGGQTQSGHWVGTLDYVAPEQIRGTRVDARADVYALGCVLHFMLTATVPFPREGDEARLWAHLSDPPALPSAAGAPASFDAVILRALAKDPAERHPSAGDLGRAALAAAAGDAVRQPERVVARGAAAPAGHGDHHEIRHDADADADADADDATLSATHRQRPAAVPAAADPATSPLRPASGRRAATRPSTKRRSLVALIAGVLLVGAVLGIAALTPDDGAVPEWRASERTPTVDAEPAVQVFEAVGERPSGVALAGDLAWVTTFVSEHLRAVDPETGAIERQVRVGEGASDIVADGNSLWVAATRADRVARLDARDGSMRGELAVRKPVALAVGGRAIWVGSRTAVSGQPDELVLFHRRSGEETERRPVPLGVSALAITSDRIWIGHRRSERVSVLDRRTGEPALSPRSIGGGRVVHMTTAYGYVWVSTENGVLGRIDPRTGRVATIAAGGRAG